MPARRRPRLMPACTRRSPDAPPRPRGLARAAALPGATALLLLAASRAGADHPGGATPVGGADWLLWLLVGGGVVAIGLAAWAFLAPDRPDSAPDEPARPPDARP